MLFSSALIPHIKLDSLASDLALEGVMIEHSGHVLHIELVRGVAQQQVGLAHARVSHEHYVVSFEVMR